MHTLRRQLAADAVLLRRTPFFLLHLFIPLLGILVFTLYQRISIYPPDQFAVAYYQVLTLIYPLLAAWLCAIVTGQETEAGDGFFLLSAPARGKALLSKLLYLTLPGLAACLLATLGYSGAVVFIRPAFSVPLSLTLWMALLIWGCGIFEYLFHTWLGLRFGRNVSLAAAAVEILLAALMLTSLGELLWYFVPSAWGVRLVALLARYLTAGEAAALPALGLGMGTAALLTLAMFVFLFLWFRRWEGQKK